MTIVGAIVYRRPTLSLLALVTKLVVTKPFCVGLW